MVKSYTQDLRVQALHGGSNSPMSRCAEAVDWIICVWSYRGCEPLSLRRGGGLYRVCQAPPALSYTGFKVHKDGAFLVTPVINIHE